MFARDKDAKPKSDDRAHETVTPLSDVAVFNPMPINQPEDLDAMYVLT